MPMSILSVSAHLFKVWNFACYVCTIDLATGRLLEKQFTKMKRKEELRRIFSITIITAGMPNYLTFKLSNRPLARDERMSRARSDLGRVA